MRLSPGIGLLFVAVAVVGTPTWAQPEVSQPEVAAEAQVPQELMGELVTLMQFSDVTQVLTPEELEAVHESGFLEGSIPILVGYLYLQKVQRSIDELSQAMTATRDSRCGPSFGSLWDARLIRINSTLENRNLGNANVREAIDTELAYLSQILAAHRNYDEYVCGLRDARDSQIAEMEDVRDRAISIYRSAVSRAFNAFEAAAFQKFYADHDGRPDRRAFRDRFSIVGELERDFCLEQSESGLLLRNLVNAAERQGADWTMSRGILGEALGSTDQNTVCGESGGDILNFEVESRLREHYDESIEDAERSFNRSYYEAMTLAAQLVDDDMLLSVFVDPTRNVAQTIQQYRGNLMQRELTEAQIAAAARNIERQNGNALRIARENAAARMAEVEKTIAAQKEIAELQAETQLEVAKRNRTTSLLSNFVGSGIAVVASMVAPAPEITINPPEN